MAKLNNKPLIEAILELRWKVDQAEGQRTPFPDPHNQLLLGRYYDRAREKYPVHQPLPASRIPDGLITHTAQHQFRAAPMAWPLLQLGHGILTVNETDQYDWPDFRLRCAEAVKWLYEAHPSTDGPKVERLTLRYLDAIPFDAEADDALAYIKAKLKVDIQLPNALFAPHALRSSPQTFQIHASFPFDDQRGTASLKLILGKKGDTPSIIIDTAVELTSDAITRSLPNGIDDALLAAHAVTSGWFEKLTEGELYAGFQPEAT